MEDRERANGSIQEQEYLKRRNLGLSEWSEIWGFVEAAAYWEERRRV